MADSVARVGLAHGEVSSDHGDELGTPGREAIDPVCRT